MIIVFLIGIAIFFDKKDKISNLITMFLIYIIMWSLLLIFILTPIVILTHFIYKYW